VGNVVTNAQIFAWINNTSFVMLSIPFHQFMVIEQLIVYLSATNWKLAQMTAKMRFLSIHLVWHPIFLNSLQTTFQRQTKPSESYQRLLKLAYLVYAHLQE